VTEEVTGIDIVAEGIRIAAGEELSFAQEDVELRGHAIECRINAEDPSENFAPAPGCIGHYREPAGPGVRVDSGVGPGSEISPMYDPMVSKLIVWGRDRKHATARMLRALGEYEISELKTLIPFHIALMASDQWAAGKTCRDLVEDKEWLAQLSFPEPDADGGEEGDHDAEKVEQDYTVEVSGRRFEVKVIGPPGVAAGAGGANGAAPAGAKPKPKRSERAGRSGGGGGADALISPIQGTVLKVAVEEGASVDQGALIAVVEAMKMENEISAHKAGEVAELPISVGSSVATGDTLAVIK